MANRMLSYADSSNPANWAPQGVEPPGSFHSFLPVREHSRRNFLTQSMMAAGAALGAHVLGAHAEGQSENSMSAAKIPTRDTELKFFPDGRLRAFKGNTVICHLQPQGILRDAVSNLAVELEKLSSHRKIAVLPSESFHMTVYPGANDQDREITGWPSDLPMTASIEECSRAIEARMSQFRLQCELPIRMKVDRAATIANYRASTLRLVGADDEEEKKIRAIRDRLVDVYHFKDSHHDAYGFHMTLGYQLQPFTAAEQQEYRKLYEHHVPLIIEASPVVEFGNPEFCTFPDMHRFDVRKLLAT